LFISHRKVNAGKVTMPQKHGCYEAIRAVSTSQCRLLCFMSVHTGSHASKRRTSQGSRILTALKLLDSADRHGFLSLKIRPNAPMLYRLQYP